MELAVDGVRAGFGDKAEDEDFDPVPVVKLALTAELSQVAGHVSAVYKGCLLVWGGYYYSYNNIDYRKGSDLYVYPYGLAGDLGVWMKVVCSGSEPKPNCGGAALALDDALYIFGGTTVLGEVTGRRRNPATSMIWKLDLETACWQIITTPPEAKVPTPRDKTSAWVVGRKFYFFGGYGPGLFLLTGTENYLTGENDFVNGGQGSCWNDQLLEFDVDKNCWRLIPKAGDVPSPRAAAGACYVDNLNTVFLFGGRHELGRLNDLYKLDTISFIWTKIDLEPRPPSRSWCTFTWIPDKKLILMLGGFSVTESPLDDVWHLDISDCYDQTPRTSAGQLKWKCVKAMTDVVDEEMGVNGFMDTDGEERRQSPPSPYCRFWHTADLVVSRVHSAFSEAIIIYGGMYQHPNNATPCLNTLHVEVIEPASLFSQTLRFFSKNRIKLPSSVFSKLYRKHFLLEDLQRFRRDVSRYEDYPRECNSLHGMTLKEIFDVLDMENSL